MRGRTYSNMWGATRALWLLGEGWHEAGHLRLRGSIQSISNSLRHAYWHALVDRVRSNNGRKYLWRVSALGRDWCTGAMVAPSSLTPTPQDEGRSPSASLPPAEPNPPSKPKGELS